MKRIGTLVSGACIAAFASLASAGALAAPAEASPADGDRS